MTLSKKITILRKKSGLSQEELAEKLDVTRQSVSKWELGQSSPDIDKILQMSTFFGVTTDYLLKSDAENEEPDGKCEKHLKRISLKEASAYLELRKKAAPKTALATLLCIISPGLSYLSRRA